MNFQSNNTIIGFVYFGHPVLVPENWYIALDGDGTLNAYPHIPTYDDDDQIWHFSLTSKPLCLGRVEDFPLDYADSMVRAHSEENVDPRLMQILSATGLPKPHSFKDSDEYEKELERRTNRNQWDKFFRDILPILTASACNKWHWINSLKCWKYLNLRVDLRDGGTLIREDETNGGNRILPELLGVQSRDPYFQGYIVKIYLYNSGEHKILVEFQNLQNESRKQFTSLNQLVGFMENYACKAGRFKVIRGNMNRKHYRQFCKDLEASTKRICNDYKIERDGNT